MNETMNEKLYGYQDGIVETVRLVLESAADGHEAITPNIAGALGLKLRAASGWYSPMDSRRTSLSDVARILLAAAREKLNLQPVLAGVFASLLAGAARTREQEGKPAETVIKTVAITDKNGKRKVVSAIDGNTKCYTGTQVQAPAPTQSAADARGRENKPAAASGATCRCEARHNNSTACGDGVVTVSGYYTPEEAEELIGKIRDWLSGCRDGHSLADLMESIKRKFQLFDSQLGELLGISDRLVGHVRHGRPSPFAKARFTEIFGLDGGVK